MMFARCNRRLPGFLAVCGLLLVSASCMLVEERIDRTAGGPNVPADTAVHMRLESTEQPEEIAAQALPPGPLKITITEAILLCLENNRSLVVQRLNPTIQQTVEDQERAVFDPTTNADVSAGRVEGERLARSGSETEDFTTDAAEGIISLEQYFPTGTTVALEGSTRMNDSSLYEDSFYST
ncbi:MAG: TolC family protein, partial [Deltaproteobacteria bacterium]|nr:TolC family protein [Deltaproteobacteria bacterium]